MKQGENLVVEWSKSTHIVDSDRLRSGETDELTSPSHTLKTGTFTEVAGH
jgi:hypothetical protein